MIAGTTDRKKKNTKKTGKTVRGLRREGEMLARFFCSSMLTESLVQASTGRNVAQSRSQGLRTGLNIRLNIVQCAWRESRLKTRIMTSNIHFLFAPNGRNQC